MPDKPTTKTALWVPAWHELDQTVVVGLRQRYFFFNEIPAEYKEPSDFAFFNRVDPAENCHGRFAKAESIVHPMLGEILRIDTFGLDYIIYPADGEELIVDAEQECGAIQSGGMPIEDWTMTVTLTEISEPIADNIA